jgi:hypothetical protein
MNNVKIVSPEKTGKNHFALADNITQKNSRAVDNLNIEQESRHLGAYVFYSNHIKFVVSMSPRRANLRFKE